MPMIRTGQHRGHTARRISGGYTLIELVVAVGLFAFIMTLASGAYLMMIGVNRQVQGISTGINNLSFALEAMTRDIRTGTNYNCDGAGDCPSGGSSLSFENDSGSTVSYGLSASALQKTVDSTTSTLTDPSVVISSLTFYTVGTQKPTTDYEQPHVTIIVTGTVSAGAGKTESFVIETGATMRGTDL